MNKKKSRGSSRKRIEEDTWCVTWASEIFQNLFWFVEKGKVDGEIYQIWESLKSWSPGFLPHPEVPLSLAGSNGPNISDKSHVFQCRNHLWARPIRFLKDTLSSNISLYIYKYIWVFPKIGIPQNGWFRMEIPIKIDDLGGFPLFLETSICLIYHLPFCFRQRWTSWWTDRWCPIIAFQSWCLGSSFELSASGPSLMDGKWFSK